MESEKCVTNSLQLNTMFTLWSLRCCGKLEELGNWKASFVVIWIVILRQTLDVFFLKDM